MSIGSAHFFRVMISFVLPGSADSKLQKVALCAGVGRVLLGIEVLLVLTVLKGRFCEFR